MPQWTFLTNHALVLSYIAHYPRITGRNLANAIGITERATRKLIADLLEAGYIAKKREEGRIATALTLTCLSATPATGKPLWEIFFRHWDGRGKGVPESYNERVTVTASS